MSVNVSVDVIVVNWNSGELLAKCFRHLELQTVKPVRVLLIDNASSDDSLDSVKGFQSVSVRQMFANLGFAAGNNRALEECASEFVALLNPDAFPEPDWLENLLSAAVAYPEAAAFGSRQLRHAHHEVLDGIGDCYHMSGLVWRERHGVRQQAEDLASHETFSPCAAAALYRRQVLADLGGFDEDYFCYVEDVDLGFRMRLAGYTARYVPDAVVRHVGSASTGGQHSDFALYHGHRNLVWTFVKNMPGVLFWLFLPMHLALNLATVIWFTLRGRGGVVLRAKRDALLGLPKMWRKRQHIQKTRVASIGEVWRQLNKLLMPTKAGRKE